MASDIAHMSFRGGGIFLPALSPYDRQVIVEHVSYRVRASGEVQVLLDGRRWMVRLHRAGPAERCARCGATAPATCRAPAESDAVYCVDCAFGAGRAPL